MSHLTHMVYVSVAYVKNLHYRSMITHQHLADDIGYIINEPLRQKKKLLFKKKTT